VSEAVTESDSGHYRPARDAAKLLATWMDWEKGRETPGRVMADLKKGGLREVLEELAAASEGAGAPERA
jgi:hypothetical protein